MGHMDNEIRNPAHCLSGFHWNHMIIEPFFLMVTCFAMCIRGSEVASVNEGSSVEIINVRKGATCP